MEEWEVKALQQHQKIVWLLSWLIFRLSLEDFKLCQIL